MNIKDQYIIFTDLDATLLDYHSYSYREAAPALSMIRKYKIPLILISSKTRSEIEYYQKQLNIGENPFVVENGCAIYCPSGYFFTMPELSESKNGYHRIVLGKKYDEIHDIITQISEKYKYNIKGFHNSTQEEISRLTELKGKKLRKALDREFSIPIFYDNESEKILKSEIDKYDLRLIFGGRFMHLLSKVDKGKALAILMNLYKKKYKNKYLKSIAIGDSLNDFPMLSSADYAILVKKFDGSFETRKTLKNVVYSSDIGPKGWNKSILNLLESGGLHG